MRYLVELFLVALGLLVGVPSLTALGFQPQPQQDVGVEQEPHWSPCSNSSMSDAGVWSKSAAIVMRSRYEPSL